MTPCPEHPHQPAKGTCARCGRFVCAICNDDGQSPLCAECRLRQADLPNPIPIGGWLILVAIGLVVSPFRLLYSLGEFFTYFTGDEFAEWRAGDEFSAGWTAFLGLECAADAGLLVLTSYAAIRFIQRKRQVPRLMFLIYAVSIVYNFVDLGGRMLFEDPIEATDVGSSVVSVAESAIWIAYFKLSTRVKRTFVR